MPPVIYEKRDRVAYVTLNRPEAMNAIDPEMHDALWATWEDFRDDDALDVAILTGAGDAFCAGADLKKYIPPIIESFDAVKPPGEFRTFVLGGSTVYGMCPSGANNPGVVFRLGTDGSGYALLHVFTGGLADGANPTGNPVLHANATFAIYWDPTDHYHGAWRHVIDTFFGNLGAASGALDNVFAVDAQYTDKTNQPAADSSIRPKSSGSRSRIPHDSQSTVNVELNGALHDGQRRSILPPHWGHSSGTSASKSSNQRRAAPQPTQNATQSPSTLRRSSRSQSEALPI